MTIRVHIATLTVRGGPVDRRALQAALERELGLRLADAPPTCSRPYASTVGAAAAVPARASADALGAEVARAVHEVLTA